jgi:hypothetical protein
MGKAKYTGDLLWDCVNLNWADFHKRHPEIKRNTYKGKRGYWKAKIMSGEVAMPPEPELVNEWDSAAYNRETNEWDVIRLKSYRHPSQSMAEPVEPRKITPSKAKPVDRGYKLLFAFSDAQIGYRRINDELIPIHDERAIAAAVQFARYLKPDVVVDCGDTTDFAELSRFPKDSTHFMGTLQPSLQRTYDMFADFTEATPNAERHTVDSNHVKRLGDYMLKNALDLSNIKRIGDTYPALSYPGLLRLDEIGWQFHGGYGHAEYEYAEDLAFKHGTLAVSTGSTAAKLSKENYGRNIVQGHAHRMETQYQTDRKGKMFGAFVVGALCRLDGAVPSFHSGITQEDKPLTHFENWQNGVLIIHDYGDGNYQFDHVPIVDGVIRYQGKEYGNES